MVDFLARQRLIAIAIEHVKQGRRSEALKKPSAAAEFFDGQGAIAIKIGGGKKTAVFGQNLAQAYGAIAVDIQQFNEARGPKRALAVRVLRCGHA